MEVELQYIYVGEAPPVVPTELAKLPLARSDNFLLTDTYFDGEELPLRKAGCSLRVRVSNGDASARLTWKGKAKRRKQKRTRAEIDLPITAPPAGGKELSILLSRHGIDRLIKKAGIADPRRLGPIGELRNDRSRHVYVRGLLRLELTWDRLEYPIGPAETRVEVEVKSEAADHYLTQADEDLRALFAESLDAPKRGKVNELCSRLYPELV